MEMEALWNEAQRLEFVHWLSTMVTTPEGVRAHHALRKQMRHARLAKMFSTTITEQDEMTPYELFDLQHMPAWLQDNYIPPANPGLHEVSIPSSSRLERK